MTPEADYNLLCPENFGFAVLHMAQVLMSAENPIFGKTAHQRLRKANCDSSAILHRLTNRLTMDYFFTCLTYEGISIGPEFPYRHILISKLNQIRTLGSL